MTLFEKLKIQDWTFLWSAIQYIFNFSQEKEGNKLGCQTHCDVVSKTKWPNPSSWAHLTKKKVGEMLLLACFETQGCAIVVSLLRSAPKTSQLWNYHKQDEEAAGERELKKRKENTHSAAYIRGQECQLRKQFCMEKIGAIASLPVVNRDRKQTNSLAMKNELERQIREKTKQKSTSAFDGGLRWENVS